MNYHDLLYSILNLLRLKTAQTPSFVKQGKCFVTMNAADMTEAITDIVIKKITMISQEEVMEFDKKK